MSARSDERGELAAHHAAGGVITGSSDAPGDTGLRQTVAIHPTAGGGARVHVETYHPTEWDTSVEDFDETFDDLESALAWLADRRGVHWARLRREPS